LLSYFSKKKESDFIIQNWQMIFQASDYKGNNFLDLLDDKYISTKSTYIYKVVSGSNFSDIQIFCVQKQQEQSLIML